jgi:hypothetical protein
VRNKLRRLEKAMRGKLSYIELADGSRHWFEPRKTHAALFAYWSDSMRAVHRGEERPEPPAVLEAVSRAKDRRAALRAVYPPDPVRWEGWCPISIGALVEEGVFVELPLVASSGRDAEPR